MDKSMMKPLWNRQRIALVTLTVAVGTAWPGAARATADDADKAAAAATATKPSADFPLGGMVALGSTVGLGTFVPGPQNRGSVSSSLTLMPRLRIANGLNISLRQDVSKTLVDNADDPWAPRPRNTALSDTLIMVSYAPRIASEEGDTSGKAAAAATAATNPTMGGGGTGKPLTLPGGIAVSTVGMIGLPTSKISQFRTRILSLHGAVNFSRGFLDSKLSVIWQARVDKFFHRYSNWVVDYEGLADQPIARTGGVESLGDNLVATRSQNTSFGFRNTLMGNYNINDAWSMSMSYTLFNSYTHTSSPIDEFSSAYATEGRGRTDLQLGSISASWAIAGWVVSADTTTYSALFSSDNQTFLFPFFDFRTAAANITTFSLSVSRSF